MTDLTQEEIRRERLVHIDQLLANHDRDRVQIDHMRQEIRFAPWQIALATITATSGVFIAGAAVGAFLVNYGRSLGVTP